MFYPALGSLSPSSSQLSKAQLTSSPVLILCILSPYLFLNFSQIHISLAPLSSLLGASAGTSTLCVHACVSGVLEGMEAVALYTFRATEGDELSFNKGDILKVGPVRPPST